MTNKQFSYNQNSITPTVPPATSSDPEEMLTAEEVAKTLAIAKTSLYDLTALLWADIGLTRDDIITLRDTLDRWLEKTELPTRKLGAFKGNIDRDAIYTDMEKTG